MHAERYTQLKEDLLRDLRAIPDRDSPTLFTGGRAMSVNDLIGEVERDTDIGRNHVEMLDDELERRDSPTPMGYLITRLKLLADLHDSLEPDAMIPCDDGVSRKVSDIIAEVENETELGKDMVLAYIELEEDNEEPD